MDVATVVAPDRRTLLMLGPLPRLHRSVLVALLVCLGALTGLSVAVGSPGVPVALATIAGAGAGALLGLVLDGGLAERARGRARRPRAAPPPWPDLSPLAAGSTHDT